MRTVDPAKIKSQASYSHAGTFYSLAADVVHGRLFAGSDDSAIHVFDLKAEKKQSVAQWKRHTSYVSSLLFLTLPSGPLVVSASYDRSLIWWDAKDGKVIRAIEGHQGWIRSLAATPAGRQFVSAGDDMVIKFWDTGTGRLLRTFEAHAKRTPQGHVTALYAIAISPDGRYAASGDRIGAVCLWELETGKLAERFEIPVLYTYDPLQRKRSIGGIRSLAFSPDGKLLAAGGIGQVGNVDGLAGPAQVELWDWHKPRRCCTLTAQGHKGLVNCLLFHAKEPWLLGGGGGSDNGFLGLWNMAAISPAAAERKEPVAGQRIKSDGHIHAFCLNAEKNELYAAGYPKLEVWSLSG